MTYFHGKGNHYAEYVPFLEERISKIIYEKYGITTKRFSKNTTYATKDTNQALDYSDSGIIYEIGFLEGSIVTWCEDVKDMILDFEVFLKNSFWNNAYYSNNKSMKAFMKDVAGDIHIFDTYISYNRQLKNIDAIIHAYFHDKKVHQIQINKSNITDFSVFIEQHNGEIWIEGPVNITIYQLEDTTNFKL